MSYYHKHVFFCQNEREEGNAKPSCGRRVDVKALREYARKKLKTLGVSEIRTTLSGCLGRCQEGPVLVIYPDDIWYRYATEADLDEIIEASVLNNSVVKRLALY